MSSATIVVVFSRMQYVEVSVRVAVCPFILGVDALIHFNCLAYTSLTAMTKLHSHYGLRVDIHQHSWIPCHSVVALFLLSYTL
jgi:hypothetical protein